MKQQERSELSEDERMLVNASLKVLHQIIGFLTTKDNAKMIGHLKEMESASNELTSKSVKSCLLSQVKTSKNQLKKLLKAAKKNRKKGCCDDIKGCFNELLYANRGLCRKILKKNTSETVRHHKLSNPYEDRDFDPHSVLNSGKFPTKPE